MRNAYKIIFILLILLVFIWNSTDTDQLKINLINHMVVLRGILAPNCPWYSLSDIILNDGAGINLYNTYKQKYGDFAVTHMFGEKIVQDLILRDLVLQYQLRQFGVLFLLLVLGPQHY